jgi:hypothetical protein
MDMVNKIQLQSTTYLWPGDFMSCLFDPILGLVRLVLFRTTRNRDHDVVLLRSTIDLRWWDFGMGREWGGDGEGMGRGRSVYE